MDTSSLGDGDRTRDGSTGVRRPPPPLPDPERLHRIASSQHGVFTRRQAEQCGYTTYQVRRRMAAGDWRAVLGTVMTTRGKQVTPRLRGVAATLAVPGAVLAGPAAARWLGMPVADPDIYLWTGPTRNPRLTGIRLIRDPVVREDVGPHNGLVVTTPARTVFDCLRLLPDREAIDLLGKALHRSWITLPELSERITAHAGRRGAPKLVRLMRLAASGSRSAAERLVTDLLRHAGISGWRVNELIRDPEGVICTGDVVFPAAALILEIDGWAYQSDRDARADDAERRRRLDAEGWTVVTFSWGDLTRRTEHVVATILTLLSRTDRRR